MSGRTLAQMCVSSMYLSGWLLGTVRIRDAFAIEGWMLCDMMPFAKEFYPDDLSLLKSDQKFYDYACSMRNRHPTYFESWQSVWLGDFAHEMMNWFTRSEFDWIHKHRIITSGDTVVVPDNLLYVCKLKSGAEAREMFEKSTSGDRVFFLEKVVRPVLPRLMNCFEKI